MKLAMKIILRAGVLLGALCSPALAAYNPATVTTINVQAQFNATGNGTTDDTTAIQAAINACPSAGDCFVYLPVGVYKTTSQITVARSRTHIVGAGIAATEILFSPSADATALEFSAGASILFDDSISDLSLFSTDSTHTKKGIVLSDNSDALVENIECSGSVVAHGTDYWSGGTGSVCLQTNGREQFTLRKMELIGDIPIEVSSNPNSARNTLEDTDHFHFQDLLLIANGNPNILVDTDVNISAFTIDGYESWVLGTAGFYWHHPSATAASSNLSISNVRTEQGVSSTAYSVDISITSEILQSFILANSVLDTTRYGVNLNGVIKATLENDNFAMSSGVAMTAIGQAGTKIVLQNVLSNASATTSLTTLVLNTADNNTATSQPLPENGEYLYFDGTDTDLPFNQANGQLTQSWLETQADSNTYNVPVRTGAGLVNGWIKVTIHNTASSVDEWGIFYVSDTTVTCMVCSPNVQTTSAGGKWALVWNSGQIIAVNQLGHTVKETWNSGWRNN